MDKVTEKVLKAALSYFVAEKDSAEADLMVFLKAPNGDVTKEVINKIEKLDHAVSCMKTMGELLKSSDDPQGDNENG